MGCASGHDLGLGACAIRLEDFAHIRRLRRIRVKPEELLELLHGSGGVALAAVDLCELEMRKGEVASLEQDGLFEVLFGHVQLPEVQVA